MTSKRLLTRAALVAATALVLGTGAGAGPASAEEASGTPTAAQHCKAERADVRAAQQQLVRAKHAKKERTAKVRAAKKNLERQRTQASRWCSAAKSEAAALRLVTADTEGYAALLADPALAGLPTELHDALVAAVAEAQARVDELAAAVPGASSSELAHIVNNLRKLSPAALSAAVTELAAQLQAAAGDPEQVALVEPLLAAATAALQAFDPASSAPQLNQVAALLAEASALLAG